MLDAPTVFAIFFGLYFAVTIILPGKFQPFDTPSMYKGNRRAYLRFFVSFLMLNILPVLYFFLVFNCLSYEKVNIKDAVSLVGILLLSLTCFGIYRIYFGMMLLTRKEIYVFFGDQLPKPMRDEWEIRDLSHKDWKAHFWPGMIWVALSIVSGSWMIFSNSTVLVRILPLAIILLYILLRFFMIKEKNYSL